MKLKSIILPSIALSLGLASCSAIYDDLDPCPQGIDISLAFTNNMEGVDRLSSDVHCSNIFIYDGDGNLYGHYDIDDSNHIDLELPAGNYRAVAFGGMRCDEASYDFNTTPGDFHHYSDLLAFLKGTRASEVSARLHDQFHVAGDFTVDADDLNHRSMTLDYIRNTNTVRTILDYSDKSAIRPSDFIVTLTADNYVTDHKNDVVPQGEALTYRPCADGTTAATADSPAQAWMEISTGRLTPSTDARLTISSVSSGKQLFKINLVEYIAKIQEKEMPGVSLAEYLNRQNNWEVKLTVDRDADGIFGLVFYINGWIINLSNTNIDL
ncbi:MAG: FimB/Mfa2 family fimbrial subunit [Muribaculaceae bacterium]|nr:FimB/Mfa2 family fimbrial subunit [Muribaculaceae bacterium]